MHTIQLDHLTLVPEEGLLLGNGDLSVSIYQAADRIIWRLGKNDVWDRRIDHAADPKPMHIDELARGICDEGWEFAGEPGKATATKGCPDERRFAELTQYGPPSYRERPYACPKPVGELAMHLPPDQQGLKISQTLTIEQGVVDIQCAWESGISLNVHCFVAPQPNALVVRWQVTGADSASATWQQAAAWFSLYRWADPTAAAFVTDRYSRVHTDQFDKHCRPEVTPLAPPTTRQLDGRWIIEQQFDGDLEFPEGFRYGLLPVVAGGEVQPVPTYGTGEARLRLRADGGGWAGWLAVGIGTSSDIGGMEAELNRVGEQLSGDAAAVTEQWGVDNLAAGSEFWSRSAVETGDAFFERLWYETLHARRCTFRGDVVAPGLFLPSTLNDFSLWHGDYHTNYNYQQPFWGAYEANQISLGDSYFPGFAHHVELGRKLARDYYNCRGTFIQLTGYPFPVADDTYGVGPFARMTYMTGWAVNQYWFRWLHTQDEDWLREVGYPPIRDAALFYLDFLQKGDDGLYHGFPSDQGENQFSPHPAKYTDRPQVMRHARYCLQIAAEAAEVLGVDDDPPQQWRQRLANFPVIDDLDALGYSEEQKRRYAINPPEFLGWEDTVLTRQEGPPDALRLRPENPLWSWYFGHFPIRWMMLIRSGAFDADRDIDAARQLIARWRLPNGLLRAMSREIYDFAGGWSESLGILGPVQEMWLQSWDGCVRLFPAWPRDVDASFTTLRAQGAFLVSAAIKARKVRDVTIYSERGRRCCLASPWASGCTVRDERGQEVAARAERWGESEIICFSTRPGCRYEIAAKD